MLVDVLVIMSMAVAGGLAVLCERAGNEGLDAGIAAALGARIDRDAGLDVYKRQPLPLWF